MVFILLFATKSELCAFIELVSIAFARDVHHYEVFTNSIMFLWWRQPHGIIFNLALVIVNSCVAICGVAGTANGQAHQVLLAFCFGTLMHVWLVAVILCVVKSVATTSN